MVIKNKKKSKINPLTQDKITFINEALGDRSIVFVGLMGCGKTTMGRAMAKLLQKPFYDSDKEIEKQTGLSIMQIFQQYGEAHFRMLEQEIFSDILAKNSAIIASGGGAFIQDSIRKQILDKHVSIWLKADLALLWHRVNLRPTRPLLQKENGREILENLFKVRQPYYKKALIHFNSGFMRRKKIIEKLGLKLEYYLQKERANGQCSKFG